ncbi:hypothetical protein B484DRAFT_405279, partial [Ochromonadaceae sp. CCMP2298]
MKLFAFLNGRRLATGAEDDDTAQFGTPTEQLENTLIINLFLFSFFAIIFESLRRLQAIYLNRYVTRFIQSGRVPEKPSNFPFAWVSKVLRVEDQ